jgi:hypothetical protein
MLLWVRGLTNRVNLWVWSKKKDKPDVARLERGYDD